VGERFAELDRQVSLQGMLGYLNFAGGKADARFQKQLNDAYGFLAGKGDSFAWRSLYEMLQRKLAALKIEGSSAFRDVKQVESVLGLVFDQLLPAYRRHHADLLFHADEQDLLQPFFLARAFEAVLLQGAPWEERERIVTGALAHLNDYVGHRPIAILETRPRGEPYEHERVRPIPLYIRGAGVGWGRYQALLQQAVEILKATEPALLTEASLDPALLDEIALDSRAYDHGHPANRRPNYVFGEWDPHHLDAQGRFRRYVIRQVTLDALADRINHPGDLAPAEILFEGAAVLAGTMLMATGTSGSSPTMYDSTTTLATLMPRIARYRDLFYTRLLETMTGAHGQRLRDEASTTRQPFGGARQHLNQYLARHRAMQLQQRQLALLFAEMGYPEASRREAARIPAVSMRLQSEILTRLTTGHLLTERSDLQEAARVLPEVEDLLRRGIACGAFADPWNILGFQGLFPLFTAREDSIRDPRIDELVACIEQTFTLYSRLISEAAAAGEVGLRESLLSNLRQLAAWWDQFASAEVSDVHRVHGGETVDSARHVGAALASWHERGQAAADLAFWRQHLADFQTPKAFSLVVDALLRKEDYRAAMALLMNWLGQAEHVPLEEGDYSFHTLALRWILGFTKNREANSNTWPLVLRFFDYLEANAEEYWQVPTLEKDFAGEAEAGELEESESLYSAAYEAVTYHDSADDKQEGSVADGGPEEVFELEQEGDALEQSLRFLSTLARLWQIAARQPAAPDVRAERAATLSAWLVTARAQRERLLALLDALQEQALPQPSGSYDSLVEYDRCRVLKERLVYTAIGTCLDNALAVGALEGVNGLAVGDSSRAAWEPAAIRLELALLRGDAEEARLLLPPFLKPFKEEPLLFTALSDGGQPRQILRVRIAQALLRGLATSLPRLGLLRETYQLLQTARAMEQAHPPQGRGVTEFNQLFQAAYQAVVEAVVDAAAAPAPGRDQKIVDLLEALTRPFLSLWVEHSQSLQLSTLEALAGEDEVQALREFVLSFGSDLFHAKFMTMANLRGILHRGIDAHFDYLGENPDPLQPIRLIEELDCKIKRADARRFLQCILQALVENYEEYKDYNTTTPHSDYGQNLHLLLDFLRLKAGYERHAWRLRPLVMAHEILARRGRGDLAASWYEAFARLTEDLAGQYVDRLAALEKSHGMRLRTVSDLIEERFVKPLALDRLCALIEPAMTDVRAAVTGKAFARLDKELAPLSAQPTGVGLDVPQWLRRLETEVQRVRAAQSSIAMLAEGALHVPKKVLTLEQLRQLVQQWEQTFATE
jgi:hypothetical protein